MGRVKSSNLGASGLQEDVAHWADVLDRWVKGVDARLGRNGNGTDRSRANADALPLDGGPLGIDGELDRIRGEP